jgi:spore coat protein U-like protein
MKGLLSLTTAVRKLAAIVACTAVLSLFALPSSAQAATATANLTVTATVISVCIVSNGAVAFGSYDPTSGTALDQSGTFTVTCTKGTSATVGLNTGANASGSVRRMTDGTDFLSYELYKEVGRTNVWGNAGGALVSLAAAASNLPQTQTVFGRVTAGQNVGVGAYLDTVLITVTF